MIVININNIGWTPLLCTAQPGHADCMTILINNGAEVNAKDNIGHTISYSSLNLLFVIN